MLKLSCCVFIYVFINTFTQSRRVHYKNDVLKTPNGAQSEMSQIYVM